MCLYYDNFACGYFPMSHLHQFKVNSSPYKRTYHAWLCFISLQNQDSNEHMAYWLSNTSTLLFLLQQSLKATGAAGSTPHRKPPPPTSLFGRMTQVSTRLLYYFYWSFCTLLMPHPFFFFRFLLRVVWIWCYFFFSGISFFPFVGQPFSQCTWCSAPSWGQVSSFAFQAATYSICWENIWNYSGQFEEGTFLPSIFLYSGLATQSFYG